MLVSFVFFSMGSDKTKLAESIHGFRQVNLLTPRSPPPRPPTNRLIPAIRRPSDLRTSGCGLSKMGIEDPAINQERNRCSNPLTKSHIFLKILDWWKIRPSRSILLDSARFVSDKALAVGKTGPKTAASAQWHLL